MLQAPSLTLSCAVQVGHVRDLGYHPDDPTVRVYQTKAAQVGRFTTGLPTAANQAGQQNGTEPAFTGPSRQPVLPPHQPRLPRLCLT